MTISNQLEAISHELDGRRYQLSFARRVCLPSDAPRLVIVAHQPNQQAHMILRKCIQSIQHFTHEPHELWVIDNNSPKDYTTWLVTQSGINVVLNNTEPLPPTGRFFWNEWPPFRRQERWGSYANAVGLELAACLVDPATQWMLTLHMDTLACRAGWLSYLRSKTNTQTRLAGMHLQTNRVPEGVLHILGCLFDFQRFRKLGLDFYPDLPRLDVGDRVTVGLRQDGCQVFACRDTFSHPENILCIPSASMLRQVSVLRSLDDDGNVIFMHLGRGVRKSTGSHRRGFPITDWLELAERVVMDGS